MKHTVDMFQVSVRKHMTQVLENWQSIKVESFKLKRVSGCQNTRKGSTVLVTRRCTFQTQRRHHYAY